MGSASSLTASSDDSGSPWSADDRGGGLKEDATGTVCRLCASDLDESSIGTLLIVTSKTTARRRYLRRTLCGNGRRVGHANDFEEEAKKVSFRADGLHDRKGSKGVFWVCPWS